MLQRIGLLAIMAPFVFGLATCREAAAEPPEAAQTKTTPLFRVPSYCEGVVFDHAGNGYVSWGKSITRFNREGQTIWAETGAPNGHKVLADGTHLVCDASHHAVLRLSADGKMLEPPASNSCNGKPLRGPNDLSLDTPHGGFYFSDPGDSSLKNPIGTIHYVNAAGKTSLLDDGLAFPNGIVLTPDGKKLYLAESQKNRVLLYEVQGPGKLGMRKVFAELPKHPSGDLERNQPDGMCLDAAGNLYVAHYGMQQVQVLDTSGKLIRQYDGGNVTTSNVAFGGPKHDQLFITGGIQYGEGEGGVFRIDLGVPGLVILPTKR